MAPLSSVAADDGRGVLACPSFAERLRDVGLQIDREVRTSMEAASQAAQHEARMLRDEVEWLQRKLEDELQQSAMRLGLCTDLKQQLGEMEDSLQKEAAAREHWQNECSAFEERHCLLEAKLEALKLTHEEMTGVALEDGPMAKLPQAQSVPPLQAGLSSACPDAVIVAPAAPSATDMAEADEESPVASESELDASDAAAVERYISVLESGSSTAALDRGLRRLSADGLHTILVTAVGRPEGAGVLVQRIVQLWVSRLLARHRGLALETAVRRGSAETLATLLGLGGTPALATAAAEAECASTSETVALEPSAAESTQIAAIRGEGAAPCLLSLCVERRDAAMLALLLEHLRGSRSGLGLGSVRRALTLASSSTASGSASQGQELVTLLSNHLVVELSHLGNAQYRQGELEGAISSYEEAIALCGRIDAPGAARPASPGARGAWCRGEEAVGRSIGQDVASQLPEHLKENMVRLRYNLARTLHRSDRWAEARAQATEVLALDSAYVNAYALRAQAAMAAFDWQAALADWDRLRALLASGAAASGNSSARAERAELLATWQKRREECVAQLSLGHYEALGLQRIAGIDEVRRAYRELARQWHPDKHRHESADIQERASRRFDRIRQAHEVLGESATKRSYDATLLLCEARPLMTGHSATTSSSRGPEKYDSLGGSSKAVEERPPPCPSPPLGTRRTLLRPSVTPSELEAVIRRHSGTGEDKEHRRGRVGDSKGAATDSPLGRRSSTDSPMGRSVPSCMQSRHVSSPQSRHGAYSSSIHVNLFDAKFVNADATKDTL